ncbi:hypothetical protein D3C87_2076310 [compost metagenome]
MEPAAVKTVIHRHRHAVAAPGLGVSHLDVGHLGNCGLQGRTVQHGGVGAGNFGAQEAQSLFAFALLQGRQILLDGLLRAGHR